MTSLLMRVLPHRLHVVLVNVTQVLRGSSTAGGMAGCCGMNADPKEDRHDDSSNSRHSAWPGVYRFLPVSSDSPHQESSETYRALQTPGVVPGLPVPD